MQEELTTENIYQTHRKAQICSTFRPLGQTHTKVSLTYEKLFLLQ